MDAPEKILLLCPLFAGIAEQDIGSLLQCMGVKRRTYLKNEYVLHANDPTQYIGIVLSGSVHVQQEDFWGNRSILSHVEPGGLFGEAFTCAQLPKLPVSVQAAQRTRVLFADYGKIANTCSSACSFHAALIRNMLQVLANKTILFMEKMEYITKRTIRDKLLAYLSRQAKDAGAQRFTIPFNRQELADYLCVDRSAMSRELGKMQQEGLLHYDKYTFELIKL